MLLVYLAAARLAAADPRRRDGLAGLAAACAFGLGPVWVSQATVAEVYALHGLFLAAIVWVVAGLERRMASVETRDIARNALPVRRITALCLLIGLALTHHRMTVLVLPVLLVYLLWRIPNFWRPRRAWLGWAAALLAPLALYAYLPLRAALGVSDLNGSYVNTPAGFLDHVLARQYAAFFAENALGAPFSVADAVRLTWRQVGAAGFVLGLIGLAQLRDSRGHAAKAWVFVLLALLSNAAFAIGYQVADREVFFIPVFLFFALFAGGGVGMIRRLPSRTTRGLWMVQGAQIVAVLLVALGVFGRGPIVDRSQDLGGAHLRAAYGARALPP